MTAAGGAHVADGLPGCTTCGSPHITAAAVRVVHLLRCGVTKYRVLREPVTDGVDATVLARITGDEPKNAGRRAL